MCGGAARFKGIPRCWGFKVLGCAGIARFTISWCGGGGGGRVFSITHLKSFGVGAAECWVCWGRTCYPYWCALEVCGWCRERNIQEKSEVGSWLEDIVHLSVNLAFSLDQMKVC